MCVGKRIWTERDTFEASQKFKERIARLRNQNLIAGISQKLAKECVCLAGARCQMNMIRVHPGATLVIVARHSTSCRSKATSLGRIAQHLGIRQGTEDILSRICKFR